MTRDEQLQFCKVCKNQNYDPKIGIICSITDRVADFDVSCVNYQEDLSLKFENGQLKKDLFINIDTANAGQRFFNHLIDSFFYLLFTFIFAFVLGVILAIVAPSFIESLDKNSIVLNYIFAFLSFVVYYSLFEFIWGRTPAKFITGTIVVDENGQIPTYGRVLLRTICRFIPFEAFSFLGNDAIGWHDSISKTRVINVK